MASKKQDPTDQLLEGLLEEQFQPTQQPPSIPSAPIPDSLGSPYALSDAKIAESEALMVELYESIMKPYPQHKPTYADCQLLMACVYGLSVRGQLSYGQKKSIEAIRKRHATKGGWRSK